MSAERPASVVEAFASRGGSMDAYLLADGSFKMQCLVNFTLEVSGKAELIMSSGSLKHRQELFKRDFPEHK